MNLVADIGGTNTRLALSDACGPVAETIRSYRNDDVDSFEAVLSEYQAELGVQRVAAACIAVAGPVAGDRARMQNRNWQFEAQELARAAGAQKAVLLNDLAALGHALPHLQADQVATLRAPGGSIWSGNGQRFVLGLGTGANLSASHEISGDVFAVLETEAGQATLTTSVASALSARIGGLAQNFATMEVLFSGAGFSNLHAALTGSAADPAHVLIEQPAAQATADLWSRLLGLALRDLVLAYLPLSGVYLAGSAARGILAKTGETMLMALAEDHVLGEIIAAPPVYLITDDAAALAGCAARLTRERTPA